MTYFKVKSFSIYNNLTFEKMQIDDDLRQNLYNKMYPLDTYVKDGVHIPDDFYNFIKNISGSFPDVKFTVYYHYQYYDNDHDCIYMNGLSVLNSVITDRLNG